MEGQGRKAPKILSMASARTFVLARCVCVKAVVLAIPGRRTNDLAANADLIAFQQFRAVDTDKLKLYSTVNGAAGGGRLRLTFERIDNKKSEL